MSIHRSDRTLSDMQYEDSYKMIYADLRQKMAKVPKRRYTFVAKPIIDAANDVYDSMLRIGDPTPDKDLLEISRYRYIVQMQHKLKRLEQPLWVYWNICGDQNESDLKDVRENQRIFLCKRFNDLLDILRKMQTESKAYDPEKDEEGELRMIYYTEKEIRKARYLRSIQGLHRLAHGKAIRAEQTVRDTDGRTLVKEMNRAWYMAVSGNKLRPGESKEWDERRKNLELATTSLFHAQRPMFSMLSTGPYSNEEIREWSEGMEEAIRLIRAVQQSDRNRKEQMILTQIP